FPSSPPSSMRWSIPVQSPRPPPPSLLPLPSHSASRLGTLPSSSPPLISLQPSPSPCPATLLLLPPPSPRWCLCSTTPLSSSRAWGCRRPLTPGHRADRPPPYRPAGQRDHNPPLSAGQ
ncbi:hypothetical protein INR49_022860, partial [Caranx melampygus]